MILTTKEAAHELGITQHHVAKLCRLRIIASYKGNGCKERIVTDYSKYLETKKSNIEIRTLGQGQWC